MKLNDFGQALLRPTLIGTTSRETSFGQARILARLRAVVVVFRCIVGSSNHV
jgi:hypothetical protein